MAQNRNRFLGGFLVFLASLSRTVQHFLHIRFEIAVSLWLPDISSIFLTFQYSLI